MSTTRWTSWPQGNTTYHTFQTDYFGTEKMLVISCSELLSLFILFTVLQCSSQQALFKQKLLDAITGSTTAIHVIASNSISKMNLIHGIMLGWNRSVKRSTKPLPVLFACSIIALEMFNEKQFCYYRLSLHQNLSSFPLKKDRHIFLCDK